MEEGIGRIISLFESILERIQGYRYSSISKSITPDVSFYCKVIRGEKKAMLEIYCTNNSEADIRIISIRNISKCFRNISFFPSVGVLNKGHIIFRNNGLNVSVGKKDFLIERIYLPPGTDIKDNEVIGSIELLFSFQEDNELYDLLIGKISKVVHKV